MRDNKVLKEVIEIKEKELYILKLQERYTQRKVISGGKENENVLGAIQGKIAASEDYLNFLKEVQGE